MTRAESDPPPETIAVEVVVNGGIRTGEVEARTTLADFLREGLGLTGTHLGCEQGVCGACTVVVDGRAIRSCLMLAVQAAGSDVTTIEGLRSGEGWHPIQEILRDSHAFQCGFCTPGFLMTLYAWFESEDPPAGRSRESLRELLAGNLCRCTGYQSILDGVEELASRRSRHDAGQAGAEARP
ncbi:(2Fe-2S)-binding protein [soil metagenome]